MYNAGAFLIEGKHNLWAINLLDMAHIYQNAL